MRLPEEILNQKALKPHDNQSINSCWHPSYIAQPDFASSEVLHQIDDEQTSWPDLSWLFPLCLCYNIQNLLRPGKPCFLIQMRVFTNSKLNQDSVIMSMIIYHRNTLLHWATGKVKEKQVARNIQECTFSGLEAWEMFSIAADSRKRWRNWPHGKGQETA